MHGVQETEDSVLHGVWQCGKVSQFTSNSSTNE